MAIEVFPTANDIGGNGTGRTASERNMIQALLPGSPRNTILTGMLPGEGTGLEMVITAGTALIDGYIVRLTDFENFTVTDDATKYVWLQLTGADAYAVTAVDFIETDDLTTEPTSAALIALVVSSGGDIDTASEAYRREGCGFITGTYTGDETSTQYINIGKTPAFVRVSHPDGDTPSFAQSSVWPGNTTHPTQNASASRPTCVQILTNGFKVGGDNTGEFNEGAKVYPYIAWF